MNYYPQISIGDVLFRSKFFGLIQHVGVVIGHDTVLSNSPDKGEHRSSVAEFAAGEKVTVQPSGAEPHNLLARARKILANPKKYHAVNRNCQHTVTEVVQGEAKSPIVTVLWIVAGIFLLCFLFRRR